MFYPIGDAILDDVAISDDIAGRDHHAAAEGSDFSFSVERFHHHDGWRNAFEDFLCRKRSFSGQRRGAFGALAAQGGARGHNCQRALDVSVTRQAPSAESTSVALPQIIAIVQAGSQYKDLSSGNARG